MKLWRRMAAGALTLTMLAGLAAGCGGKRQEAAELTLTAALGNGPETLDPIYAVDREDQTILAHLYEPLLRQAAGDNGAAIVTGGLAKSWEEEENRDGTHTWTFKLRNARWSDGRAVKARDFVYAWRRLANPTSGSPFGAMMSVVAGYDEMLETGDLTLLQVEAKNDSTLEVVLTGDYDWFLTQVCTAVAASPLREDVVIAARDAAVARNKALEEEDGVAGTEKWWTRTENLVTNGPYAIEQWDRPEGMTLCRSEKYSEGTGPDRLVFREVYSPREAQTLYDQGEVDLICPMPDEWMEAVQGDESWSPTMELATYTALLNSEHPLLADALVRQALALAVDRNALAQVAGVTARPAEALVPAGVPDNGERDFRTCAGALLDNDPETYEERCLLARQLLGDAGYDSGVYLGELELLHEDDPADAAAAAELARQWMDVLRVQVKPVAVTEKALRAALREGDYALACYDLRALGNDAECFLMLWTGDSPSNYIRYSSSAYDTLLSIIASAPDGTARLGCLHDAEELLVHDHALVPLYHRITAWSLRSPWQGMTRDPRGWFWLGEATAKTES